MSLKYEPSSNRLRQRQTTCLWRSSGSDAILTSAYLCPSAKTYRYNSKTIIRIDFFFHVMRGDLLVEVGGGEGALRVVQEGDRQLHGHGRRDC